jgi:hypothetical protein
MSDTKQNGDTPEDEKVSDVVDPAPSPGRAPFDDEALRKLVKRAMSEEPSASVPIEPTASQPAETSATSDEEVPADAAEDVAIQSLLRKSMVERGPVVVPDLVTGVQKKLRKRSRGKFYADGWSTATSRTSYVLVAVAMLVVVALAYLVLGPTGISVH